jgi:hypothetical protein
LYTRTPVTRAGSSSVNTTPSVHGPVVAQLMGSALSGGSTLADLTLHDHVGATVGAPLGALGATVGCAVGAPLGAADGVADGASVGAADGAAVGAVGAADGAADGLEVGAAHCASTSGSSQNMREPLLVSGNLYPSA